ncbi:MAG: 7TM diverse intracellular signaling domain-containing protein [Paraglaciecola sp.]|uniref:7TM diverse intracellular signaling domain-containing protein n=1 Tax=Paraglaciecola sp. TaxID=1920173 RepID=UPI0032968AF2
MKQIKLLVCFVFFCLCLTATANGTAAKKIVSFDLSKISNSNISNQVSYFSLNNNTNPAPNELPQLAEWLGTLPIQHGTNLLGDKYAVSFEIYNDTQQTEWFIYPNGSLVQHIEIRYYSDMQPAMSFDTGHGLDNQQDFHYGSSIEILPGQRKTLLLLFESDFFSSPIRILVKPQADAERLFQIESVILLLCLGICFALGIYNLFIFITTRDPKYIYYAVATSCYALGWAIGFGVPEFVGINHAEYWLIPTFLVGGFFSIFFNIRFLRLEEFSPKICKVLKLTATASLIALPIAFYSPGIGLYLAFIISSVILITGVYAGIHCWIKGYSPAKYFVFALLSVALPNIIGNLVSLGVLPGFNANIYLLSLVGVSLDSLLLAFALAAQVRLLSIHNKELTATLEKTVEKRTAELRHANIQLEQSNAELIEASNAKGRFLATMSHEIRTPLTSIIGYADGILHGDIDKSEQARVTKIIAENGNHLLSVINDILDISKIEANKLDFESIATPLFSVLAQIESIAGKRVRDKGLAFHLEYEFPLPAQINTDPTRLKQILFNLTNNAIKFTEQGYIGLSVRILNNRLQIQVKDSGEGISAQQQEQLFQPFTQADSSTNRRFGGTGLGLSIARRLAKGLGGDINVISAPRKGSTFILDFNLDVVQDSPWINNVAEIWQSTTTKSVLSTPLPNFVGNKVLLADDHPNNRELIAILLKRMNITVTEVEDGKQVLETIFYQTFDLILLDIHMPQMDGTDALKQIRAAGNYTPVIALTANNMKHEVDHYMRLGFSDHLAKPISRDNFISKLSLYLNKQGDIDSPLHQGDMLKLIKDYQLDLREQIANLQKALDQGDLTIISEIAHRIRGSAGSFGFDIIGQKFADIEHCALQDDEIAVTYELPKVIALTEQCIDLPGVDIATGIIKHHNSAEKFLLAIFELIEHSQQTLEDLRAALENNEIDDALEHFSKFFPNCYECALVRSEVAFKTLENLLKQGQVEPQQYSTQLEIIAAHLTELRAATQGNLMKEI